ncbi:MFS general substrate transporter [Xylona heveae TC161]|uniref:MFS general substrate transporter n=1 Tax=Xylona heveae (strain CBS 132557 / TC161) TaxID=1328760 RepID=A0A164ZU62_XYLHT|nr:MFS general substrate transporter [Xylona heveae TC161]KZF19521.1 MFS general substrate transporter [Xylona heveae TC161]
MDRPVSAEHYATEKHEMSNKIDPQPEGIMTKEATERSEGDVEIYIDPKKEKKLLLKLDLFLIPVVMLVYIACYLDRSNIGNAVAGGLPADIHASSQQISVAVSILFVTYVTLETPCAIIMKKVTPRVMITSLTFIWALVTIFTGFIQSIGGLYATRLLLGACEAGLFPCLNLYLTMVYRREEQAKRVSYLFSSAALAGAFGGLLAYGLLQMDGVAGKAGWRWLYIIEGILTILCAAAAWFGLPNDPSKAYFLNAEERELVKLRRLQAQKYLGSEEFSWQEVKAALCDPKLYISGSIQFCQDILLYGFSTFLPSILKSMGYNKLQSQYLTIPVYIFGALCFFAVAFASDYFQKRGPCLLVTNIFGIAAYIILIASSNDAVKYFACFLAAIAVYNGPGINLTWLNVNVAPHYRRATAIGAQQTIGNLAGIVAGQIYRKAPYKLGNSFSLGAVCVVQFIIAGKIMYIRWLNRRKERIASGEIADSRTRTTTGDAELDFKYHY